DFLYFVDRLTEVADIQYIASASWGKNIFTQTIRQGPHQDEYMNKVLQNHLNGKIPLMTTVRVNSSETALMCKSVSDMVGASTTFVTEPEFVTKLEAGKEDEIFLGLTDEKVADLKIPVRAFKDIVELMDFCGSLSQETRDNFRKRNL